MTGHNRQFRRPGMVVGLALFLAACESSPTAPSPSRSGPPSSDGRGGRLYSGSSPQPSGFTSRLVVTGSGGVGVRDSVELCVWDYATIDGDEINLWFANEPLFSPVGDRTIRLQASRVCWTLPVTAGYYYEIRMRALNEGSIPPNTGAIQARIGFSTAEDQWEVPQRTGGTTSLIVSTR